MIIRPASQDEFKTAVEWAAAEGWNPGLDDLEPFFAADPNGFLMGFVHDQPVACISVVRYGAEFGFLGFYIVAEKFRGRGLGLQIWQEGMDYLNGRCVGLDGVVAQQDNYRKSGFEFAYNNVRFTGVVPGSHEQSSRIVPAGPDHLAGLTEFDRQFFPAPRQAFIESWTSHLPDSRQTLVHVADGDGDGDDKIDGFGTIRKCRDGYKIGPLVADQPEIAEELFLALANTAHGEAINLDVPQPNDMALALAREYGLKASFETARMYRGDTPNLPLERCYGVTTFELG